VGDHRSHEAEKTTHLLAALPELVNGLGIFVVEAAQVLGRRLDLRAGNAPDFPRDASVFAGARAAAVSDDHRQ
jgi:hypothetical protein